MPKIRQLPPEIANKIAAGEVIERPASVVKELVENAIDAGATKIDVELQDAGKQLVRVADNGCGMDADDLRLCFSEHATSKISNVGDLAYIDTMGFRGEALPSIASISHVRAVSRTANGEAFEVTNHGGELSAARPASGAQGTAIEVANLFYNTPVRRRFLRQNSTEVAHVSDVIERLALAYPDIGFSLTSDGNESFRLPPGQSRKARVLEFAGSGLANDLIEINDFDDYASLTGFVASVNQHRPNSRNICLFVNRRFIRDRSLMQAVVMAFREFIPHGRYPMAWLFLELDPSEVDVNVHPTKIEVRFVQANRLFGKIKAALQEAVLRSGQLPRVRLDDQRIEQVKALGASHSQARIHEAMQDFLDRAAQRGALSMGAHGPIPEARPGNQHEPDLELATPGYDSPEHGLNGAAASLPSSSGGRASFLDAHAERAARPYATKTVPETAARFELREAEIPGYAAEAGWGDAKNRPAAQPSLLEGARGLFQVGHAYIVVESPDGMVLVDQHAYHERILFWQLEHRLRAYPPEMQRLLVPEPLELSRTATAMLGENLALFREFGFEFEPFGSGGYACYGVPKYVRTSKIGEFVRSSLEEIASSGRARDVADLRKSMVEMMACKAAIKAGDELSGADIQALLAEGAKVPHTFACPHGRPTTFKLTFTDLEKFFHRR